MPAFRSTLMALLAAGTLIATAACVIVKPENPQVMTPSITYLHLLRHTPFFTALNTDQLRWVIRHSREWEVPADVKIVGSDHPEAGQGYWVLLDGGWELRLKGQTYASGHDDAGKWFDQALLNTTDFALVANERSYVMHITSADMDDMLARGFRFDHHLEAGKTFYQSVVSSAQQAATPR